VEVGWAFASAFSSGDRKIAIFNSYAFVINQPKAIFKDNIDV
jgi:hypothetical protein